MAKPDSRIFEVSAKSELIQWLFSAALFLPMLAIYILHFLSPPEGARSTGFLQDDQISYMIFARSYFVDYFWPTYGLPYSPDPQTPRIYFQAITLFLGLIRTATGWDAGLIYVVFGIISAICMFRVALAMLTACLGPVSDLGKFLIGVVFLWGGGVLSIAGIIQGLRDGLKLNYWDLRFATFQFDPAGGYWFLNLGRNIFYSLESFYHVLFFMTVLMIWKARYKSAIVLMALASMCHPFTGVELLLVVGSYCALELFLRSQDRPPTWFLVGTGLIFLAHVGYYIGALNYFSPEHRSVQKQWALDWIVEWRALVFAYVPVGALALLRLAWLGPPGLLKRSEIRFLLVWFAVCFALINHELFMPPHQPAHFTRGYVWTPLALLAAPLVAEWFSKIFRIFRVGVAVSIIAPIIGIATFDNVTWFGRMMIDTHSRLTIAVFVSIDALDVIKILSAPDMKLKLLVSDDQKLMEYALLQTHLRAWVVHGYTAPDVVRRKADFGRFLATSEEPSEWKGRDLVLVLRRAQIPDDLLRRLRDKGFQEINNLGRFVILTRDVPRL